MTVLITTGTTTSSYIPTSAAAAASKAVAAAGASQLALAMPVEGMAPSAAAAAMAEAVRLSLYTDQRFKSESDPSPSLAQVELLGLTESAQAAVRSSSAVCSGVELARQLVAAPPNVLTPAALADTAASIGREFAWSSKCSSAATAKPSAWALI